MDAKKLTAILVLFGILLLIISLIWWGNFYGADGANHTFKCLYSSGGICDVATFFGGFSDKTPYNPAIFWIGLISLSIGTIIGFSIKEENNDLPCSSDDDEWVCACGTHNKLDKNDKIQSCSNCFRTRNDNLVISKKQPSTKTQ